MKKVSKQRGFALLVFVTLLITASAAVAVKALNHSSSNVQIARDKITAAALAQAKDALIGFAITYGDTHSGQVHGYLPCPDTNGSPEGTANPPCGNQDVSVIGRMPWRTLNISPLRGGDNECLWYAVSGSYKDNPKTGLMNWDTNGLLQVYAADGTTLLTPADNQAVAVIFAPGNASPSQNRTSTDTLTCGGNYTASNYLDTVGAFNNAAVSGTANAISQFRLGDATSPTSDRIIFITKQDIWNALQKRNNLLSTLDNMTRKTAECIADYGRKNALSGNHSLPWPTRLTLSDYGDVASYYDKKDLYAGRVPYQVDISRAKTGNSIASDYLLTKGICDENNTNCVNNCPNPNNWANISYPWWYSWKEHLFYAISKKFKPDDNATDACVSGHCVSVNAPSSMYAAVVMFAGQKLSGITRTDKSVVADYLEGSNASNIDHNPSGNENYQLDATSSTFNDVVYCIKEDLTVVKGNPLLTPACP